MTLIIDKADRLEELRLVLRTEWLAKRKYLWHRIRQAGEALGLCKSPDAIFLVGSGRSGTDIMAHCLDQSLNIRLINEYSPVAFDNWRLKSIDVVQKVVSTAGAPFVLLKPIVETQRVIELLDRFPGSKAIFIVRDYRAAISSMVKFFGVAHVKTVQSWLDNDFAEFPQTPKALRDTIREIWQQDSSTQTASGLYWLLYNSSYIFLDMESNARIHLVSYENLVMVPEPALRKTCEFIGLPYKKAMHADIYSSSAECRDAPKLPPGLRQQCEKVWKQLNACVKASVG